MRNLTIWGAVAVLAVLVATVAVFGSTDSAQAGPATCSEPTGVGISAETFTSGAGITDNTYDVDWGDPGDCDTIDFYTVVLTVCSVSGGAACKSVKVDTADGITDPITISLGDAKGIASKRAGDILIASVQAKHADGKNGMHEKGVSAKCVIEGDDLGSPGPEPDCT